MSFHITEPCPSCKFHNSEVKELQDGWIYRCKQCGFYIIGRTKDGVEKSWKRTEEK